MGQQPEAGIPAQNSSPVIEYSIEDRVAVIRLNRPDKMNAFDGQMAMELKLAVSRAAGDPQVRAIVLTGAGRAFCAGADMSSLSQGVPLGGDPETMAKLDSAFSSDLGPDLSEGVRRAERFGYLIRTKKPVIVAINGLAVGLGLVLALYADVRFASDEAYFMSAFGQRGLVAEHGMAWLLNRLVGPGHAMDMLISSRRISAEEARRMGLVSELAPKDEVLAKAVAYAKAIASTMSPRSVAVMKAQAWHADLTGFDAALATAVEEMRLSVRHPDKDEGVAHFLQKRAPRFADI